MKRLGTLFLAAAVTTVIISGCTTTADGEPSPAKPTASSSTPTETPVAAPATPTPSPTAESTPESHPTDPLDLVEVYALCKAQTVGYVSKSYNASWVPFEEAITAVRDDGVIGVYIETIDIETGNEMASVCQVGGTLGSPEWASYGVQTRNTDRDAIVSSLTAHEQS